MAAAMMLASGEPFLPRGRRRKVLVMASGVRRNLGMGGGPIIGSYAAQFIDMNWLGSDNTEAELPAANAEEVDTTDLA